MESNRSWRNWLNVRVCSTAQAPVRVRRILLVADNPRTNTGVENGYDYFARHCARRAVARRRRILLQTSGVSRIGETIRRAQSVHPISDLQIEYSLISRGPETTIFPVLAELGIGVTAYGVLSRGLLSGSKPTLQGDFRAHLPRFTVKTASVISG